MNGTLSTRSHSPGPGRVFAFAVFALLLTACSKDAPQEPANTATAPANAATAPTNTATAPANAPTPVPAPQQTSPGADAVELEYWKTIKDSEHTQDFWSYLEKYPNGAFADLAKARIERVAGAEKKAPAVEKKKTADSGSGNIRAQRKDIVRSAIRSELRGYSDRRLHIAPDIPRFKLDNVASLHGLDPRRVLLLYDDGSGGGGKTGFCLTDRRIYWRMVAGSDAYYLDYEDIDSVRVNRSGFTVNGYDVPTTLASNSRLAAERFGDMVERIGRDMRRR